MLALRGRQDNFRLILPKDFLCKEIEEKYSNVLKEKHGVFKSPIDFLNETIQRVEVLGFTDATIQQQQSSRGEPLIKPDRIKQNNFMYPSTDYNYRSEVSPWFPSRSSHGSFSILHPAPPLSEILLFPFRRAFWQLRLYL